jgi:hypothetical protein
VTSARQNETTLALANQIPIELGRALPAQAHVVDRAIDVAPRTLTLVETPDFVLVLICIE